MEVVKFFLLLHLSVLSRHVVFVFKLHGFGLVNDKLFAVERGAHSNRHLAHGVVTSVIVQVIGPGLGVFCGFIQENSVLGS